MKKSVIGVNTMVSMYIEYGLDDDTWNMFYQMACHSLINSDTWDRFSTVCGNWVYDDATDTIIDYKTSDTVAVKNENGQWELVK